MADACSLRIVQREQLHAVDSIQYYSEHCNALLQCLEFSGRHDKHDIYDNIYTIDISRQLSAR